MRRFEVGNDKVRVGFAVGPDADQSDPARAGIMIDHIADVVLGHDYLASRTCLFEYAINNGPPRQSSHHVTVEPVDHPDLAAVLPALDIHGNDSTANLSFHLHAAVDGQNPAVLLTLTVTRTGDGPVFLRMVFPKLLGDLRTRGRACDATGMVSMEIGSTAQLATTLTGNSWQDEADGTFNPGTIGMPYRKEAKRIGLPDSMNTMELASLYSSDGAGMFVADIDNDINVGKSPVQFTMSSLGITGLWIEQLVANVPVAAPCLAIGVHPTGDWHAAVDYYTAKHRRGRWQFPPQPAWFADQAAIYAHSAGGGGGMYLANAHHVSLADGGIGTAFEFDGGWSEWGPVPITTAGLAPAGAPLAVALRPIDTEDLFVVDHQGAIAWTPLRLGAWGPVQRITDPDTIPPRGHIAAVGRHASQVDVFFVDRFGALRSLFGMAVDASSWNSIPLSETDRFLPGAPVAAIIRYGRDVDVFAIDKSGAVCWRYERNNGPWSPTLRTLTAEHTCSAPSYLAALARNAVQTDVFFVGADRRITTLYKYTPDDNGPWHVDALSGPVAPTGAGIAAIVREGAHGQDEEVFVIGDRGTIQHAEMHDNGGWHPTKAVQVGDRSDGFAPPGAPICAVSRESRKTDVFFVAGDGAMIRVYRSGDEPWLSSNISTHLYTVPPAVTAAIARNEHQLDTFVVMHGTLRSFRDLPDILRDAQSLGTDIVYLYDYWDGRPRIDVDASGLGPKGPAWPPYFNKGDYIPRDDLGGVEAFKEGIAKVHASGGKVILYVEPFIIWVDSEVSRKRDNPDDRRDQGEKLAGRFPPQNELLRLIAGPGEWGEEWRPYDHYHTMVPTLDAWKDHIVGIVKRLTHEYHADGIFLDSFGWRMNYPMYVDYPGSERQCWPIDYTRGVLKLTDLVGTTIGLDRVVLTETPSGPIGWHCHGGVSADFGFDRDNHLTDQTRITASPVRYGIPEIRYFSNGGAGDYSLNRLHQIYAAGHGLALCYQHIFEDNGSHVAHIKRLVETRRAHADTLIHGKQIYQPATEGNRDDVAAYFYRSGRGNTLITVVNTGQTPYFGRLRLRAEHAGTSWIDVLTGQSFVATGTSLPVYLPGAGPWTTTNLRVLRPGSPPAGYAKDDVDCHSEVLLLGNVELNAFAEEDEFPQPHANAELVANIYVRDPFLGVEFTDLTLTLEIMSPVGTKFVEHSSRDNYQWGTPQGSGWVESEPGPPTTRLRIRIETASINRPGDGHTHRVGLRGVTPTAVLNVRAVATARRDGLLTSSCPLQIQNLRIGEHIAGLMD